MEFDWTPAKSERNLRGRAIGFDKAARIFLGPVIEYCDSRKAYGEVRIIALGVADGREMVVVYPDRNGVRRIISARRANKRERSLEPMARSPQVTRMTLREVAGNPGTADESRLDAMTDEDIAHQIADDPDVGPDVTTLGDPLPDLKRIRAALGLNQNAFAAALGLPLGTVRNWEQRRTIPDPAAIALLRVVEREPDAVFRALAGRPKGSKPNRRAEKAA